MAEASLAGLVAARICHDLVSPVGAIENALDLMGEFGAVGLGEEAAILRQSAERASALLRLHRLAFGRLPDVESRLTRADVRHRIDAVLSGARIEMRWMGVEGPALGIATARLLTLMAMSARACLGMRGRITIGLPLEDSLPLGVGAEGDAVAVGEAERAWLEGRGVTPPDPRQVEFALLPGAAAEAGARLTLRSAEGSTLLTALPA